MKKIHFFVFCVLIFIGAVGFFALSCRTEKGKLAPEEPGLVSAVEEAGEIPASAVMVQNAVTEPEPGAHDLITAAFRDPAMEKEVLEFFLELTGSLEVAKVILTNAASYGIPAALAFSLCAEESGYNPRAINHNRNNTVDRGLFQLNSASFPALSTADFYDPGINARHGLSHLRWCLDTAGTEVAGLAMYNAGTARVRSGGTPKDTLDYISRILRRQKKIEEHFLAVYPSMNQKDIVEEIPVKTPFRLSLLTPLGR